MEEDQVRKISVQDAEKLVNRSRTLSSRVASHNSRIAGERDSLAEEVKLVRQDILRAIKQTDDSSILAELKLAKAVLEGHGPGGDLLKLLKQPTPALLKLLLGQHCNVMTLQRKEAIKLKEEYHTFRDRSGVILFALASVLLLGLLRADAKRKAGEPFSLTPPFMVGVQAFLAWLLYFYTALALRENVLKVNGSSIRPWWIHHHYWAMITMALLLTLPVDSRAVQSFVRRFLWWSTFQGVVMMVQNRYQRRRMYTRIALGKNRAMDVVSGESSGGTGQLLFLYPLLFALQILQCWIGACMLSGTFLAVISPEGWLDPEAHESDLRGSRGVAVAGGLLIFMGVANFQNTVATIMEKRKRKPRPTSALQKESRKPSTNHNDKAKPCIDQAETTQMSAERREDGQPIAA
ncbi:hypothetical protein CVIRNUC_002183 [Coccomyxa viridis]|uniref:TMPIT-like protein n=1 Tax=Coccomyxa viridis TaxID=1274662 RepID=A0AAV1HV70_9CHLO|nr:hypothetical protein CVIRNUC_002183 [Coccomyxa viridis]